MKEHNHTIPIRLHTTVSKKLRSPSHKVALVAIPFGLVLLLIGMLVYFLRNVEVPVDKYGDLVRKREGTVFGASGTPLPSVLSLDTSVGTTAVRSSASCSVLQPHENVSGVLEDFMLCFDESKCTGRLTFSYVDRSACFNHKRQLSRNATLDTFLVNDIGPDVFRYRLEGPETLAGMITYDRDKKRCAYDWVIPELHRDGVYRLSLEWLYDKYNAQDEITNQWPPLQKISLLPVDPDFTTQYHLQQCTLPSTTTVTCRRRRVAGELSALSKCNGMESDTSGRWVVDEANVGRPVYTRVRVRKIQRNPIVFQWALQPDVARHWKPRTCRMLPLLPLHVLPFFSKASQRIVIGGDSQSRALYFGVANYLNNHGSDCVRNISTLAAEPHHCIENVKGSQRKQIGGVQLDFVDDLFLERFANSERYTSYQTIVIGFGQHPASKEHWSFDKYRGSFWGRLRKAIQLKRAGKNVVWYLAPQYPHTKQGFPVVVRDWRTDVRLSLFNRFAKQHCQLNGIPVVDAFAISTAYSHTSPDQAHFSNFVSFELVRMLLNVICQSVGGGGGGCADPSDHI